jgi:hypothetical protein
VSVNDLYLRPTMGELAGWLDAQSTARTVRREVRPRTGLLQVLLLLLLLAIVGLRWATIAAALSSLAALAGVLPWAPTVPWWWLVIGWLVLFSPPGRIGVAAGGARLLLRGVRAGSYPRGGSVHIRLWAATRLAELSGATGVTAAAWTAHYARALGAKIGKDVDLHAVPPVTGMLKLGRGAAVEPDVDLSGHWVDGDVVHTARSGSARRRGSGPAARCSRACGSAGEPRSSRARQCVARCPRGSAGRGLPPRTRGRSS